MKFSGRVLALDIATVTGWAVGAPGEVPEFGSVRFGKKGASRAETYRAFRTWLEDKWNVRGAQPEMIIYESPLVPSFAAGKTNIDTLRLLSGLCENLEEWSLGKFELHEATVSKVRVFFIGGNYKSRIAKPLVLERCNAIGWPCTTTDESDACALLAFQLARLRPDLSVETMPLFYRPLSP